VADRSNPLEVLVKQNHDPNTYDPPGLLDFSQTYYWRIDEVNTPDDTIFKGNVWQFTVEPFAYPIAGDLITAAASSVDNNDTGAVNTINGSGLDDNDEHSSDPSDMWVSNAFDPNQPWIQYELGKVYKLNEMLVWNPAGLGLLTALGVKDALIEYSVDGSEWKTLDTVELPQAAKSSVDLQGIVAQTIKITVQSNWSGGFTQQIGLGEVRFLATPMAAWELSPADGTALADLTAALSWRAGRQAASHDIYISTDELAVIDGTAPLVNVTESSYTAALDMLDTTYYWKVNEVNEVEDPSIWEGDVLSFSVGQNWTKAGAATLVLYFHGAEGNAGQLYVKVNGSKVVYDGDAGDIAKVEWKQWTIDLAPLGAGLQNVTKLAIGIDGNGANGTFYVDDIRLYRSAPEPQVN